MAANQDGSLPGTPTQLFPNETTRTVDVRLNKGPGTYVVAARAKGFTDNAQFFSPWAAPVAIRAFAPFDLKSFRWTDSRGPSYRFHATITEPSTTGRVSIAIGRGTKGKYKSFGSANIRNHPFSKRFWLSAGSGGSVSSTRATPRSRRLRGAPLRDHAAALFRGATFRAAAVR